MPVGNINNANTSPLTNFKNARTQIIGNIGRDANTIIMGYDSALVLAETTELKTLLQYTNPDMVSGSGLPKTIRGMKTVVGIAQRNGAGEGQPYVGSYVWDASNGTGAAVVAYVAPNPGLKTVSLGYTFDAPDDTTGQRGISVRRWREDKRKGDMIEAGLPARLALHLRGRLDERLAVGGLRHCGQPDLRHDAVNHNGIQTTGNTGNTGGYREIRGGKRQQKCSVFPFLCSPVSPRVPRVPRGSMFSGVYYARSAPLTPLSAFTVPDRRSLR